MSSSKPSILSSCGINGTSLLILSHLLSSAQLPICHPLLVHLAPFLGHLPGLGYVARCEYLTDYFMLASSPRGETASQRQLVGQASVKSYSEPHLIDPNQQPPNSKDSRRERPNKNKFGTILSRTKSTHREESPVPTGHAYDDNYPMPPDSSGLRTAPLEMKLQDKGFREMMRQSKRNRSADRAPPRTRGRPDEAPRTPSKERRDPTPTAAKDLHSGHFFQNIRNSKSKASDLGKAGKGLFGKLTRSGSSHDRENGDGGSAADIRPEDYEPSIMRLPIIEQTRKTRISKRLEDSRDKTEFWLPALPWRCIE